MSRPDDVPDDDDDEEIGQEEGWREDTELQPDRVKKKKLELLKLYKPPPGSPFGLPF